MKDEQRIVEWEMSPQEIEEFEAEILEDLRMGRLAAVAPSPRLGAIWYHDWLERDLPPGVQFPIGVNHWLREPVFSDDHWLPQGDGPPMTWLEFHIRCKAHRESRREISVPKPAKRRHKLMPSCLIRCIHATFKRVTPERIADWYLDLPDWQQEYVRAFIVAEAPSDRLIKLAGSEIATRLARFSVTMAGKRGRPKESTRNAYLLAALSALFERFAEGELARPLWYEGGNDWCAAIANVFDDCKPPVTAGAVHEVWRALSDREQECIRGKTNPSFFALESFPVFD